MNYISKNIRKKILYMVYRAGEGHIPSSFSVVEIIQALYSEYINKSVDVDNNIFVLSKGHASAALFAALHEFSFIDFDLSSYCRPGSILGGHPDHTKVFGVEASTGSLGQGLSIAVGKALGKKIRGDKGLVFVLVGDGEMNEGSIWESIMIARNLNLDNIILVIEA